MVPIESAEPTLRLGIFIALFALLAVLESLFPRRRRGQLRRLRWPGNIGISVLNQIALRIVIPATAAALAARNVSIEVGMLNLVDLPSWIELIIAVLILDLAIYLQHRLFHMVPIFWRLHRMHHADTDFDVSTGIRFHTVSILLSALIKLGTVYVLGPSVLAVLLFEVLLNATSLFNHSNLRIPDRWDKRIRCVVVTPDMHRVHHSIRPDETNSNFGFNFPWWDRLFGTYRAQPVDGHREMLIGLNNFRNPDQQRIDQLLLQPFRK